MIRVRNKKISSIGEERMLLSNKTKAGKASLAEKRKLQKLQKLTKTKNVFGEVFITKSSDFGDPTANHNKTRRVVAVKANDKGMMIVPVKKTGMILPLSRFDGSRMVNVRNAKWIDFKRIYEKRKFPKTANDSLTRDEKRQLYRRVVRSGNKRL